MPSHDEPTSEPAFTPRERHILEHATGWLSRDPLYRNRFIAWEGNEDWSVLKSLCERGAMREVSLSGGSSVFCLTMEGIRALAALPDQPKRTKAETRRLDALIAANRTVRA